MNMEEHLNLATNILVENIYCSVATCSCAGEPWSSPLYYSLDTRCCLYWASAMAAVHSRFLEENPRAFVSIFDSSAPPRTATGLYLRGDVEQVDEASLDMVVERHFARVRESNILTGKNYLNESPERMYCFSPVEIWVLGCPEAVDGHHIDQRVRISLEDLHQAIEARAKSQHNNCLQPISFT